MTGHTYSSDFPTTSDAYDDTHDGYYSDAFISKLDSNLQTLLASTFLGGERNDDAYAIAVADNGDIYVAGMTESSDFPTTTGAYDETYNGQYDAFISKLDSSLQTLLASTFLGANVVDGSQYDGEIILSIAIADSGDVYVTGFTESSDFPTTTGAYDETYNGNRDVFVSRLDSELQTLLASTFLGGNEGESESATSIAINNNGDVYATGYTGSSDFPTTPDAYDETYNGQYDAFISRLDSSLQTLLASTFLGGSSDDHTCSMAIDNSGSVYVTGFTYSPDFPTTPGDHDETYNGVPDAFISKLDSDLQTLLASTFLGGSDYDVSNGIALADRGDVYVAGYTESFNFPTTPGAYNETHNGQSDAFISKLDSDLSNANDAPCEEAVFNTETKTLDIPTVVIRGSRFTYKMRKIEGGVFRVISMVPNEDSAACEEATLNPQTGILNIPTMLIGDKYFNFIMEKVETGVFTAIKVIPH